MTSYPEITRANFDAVLFDLDGVLTSTAKLHAAAWKQTFDRFLKAYAEARKETFIPFDISEDYRVYVDGKSRFDGVQSFLASRGIDLSYGAPTDPPPLKPFAESGTRRMNW
jgi:beta-phosphoglucomutase-like phosphatase (HAD superfamily)